MFSTHISLSIAFVLLTTPLLCFSAAMQKVEHQIRHEKVLSEEMGQILPHQERREDENHLQNNKGVVGGESARTFGGMTDSMNRLMDYFRNADIFASIRTMLDDNNGVKKEWVPLGSLIFNRPLGKNPDSLV